MIEAKDLLFKYNETVVLDRLNFTISPNEFVSFIGPSGCGKTTLLNLISGVTGAKENALEIGTEHISFVFQHDTLLSWRTALNNVLLPFEVKGERITEELRERALRILKEVGLESYENHYPSELSGGMKKRVEIARALVTEPDLLILDEPFSSLDIITREKLNLLIKELKSHSKKTIVMVTHSVEEACFLSDRVYVLSTAPARILSVKEISRKAKDGQGRYILTPEELEADRLIREEAKLLWNTAPSASATELSEKGAKSGISFKRLLSALLIPIELVFLFLLLTGAKYIFNIADYLFPYPTAILERFIRTLANGTILVHLGTTVFESLSGFLIAFVITLLLGYLIAKSPLVGKLTMPYLIAFNTIPSVAIAPFLVLWFGFGFVPRIIVSIVVIFFPMLINTISAIRIAGEQMNTLIRFYKPGRLKTFTRFELPATLPIIFSGVKVSITLSVIGAVVGEFISGSEGLGALLITAKANFDTELMFVALVWLVILGLSYYGFANFIYSVIKRKINH